MAELINEADLLVCHNAIRHDMPLMNRLLGLDTTYEQYADSLALSWYLNFSRNRHGLESYGPVYDLAKPKVSDWKNLSYEEYAHRCEEDVKINWFLWTDLRGKLEEIYGNDSYLKCIRYLSFKMDCAREQEQVRWKLDVFRAQGYYDQLVRESDSKTERLSLAMPKRVAYKTVNRPKIMYKKDGTLSANGIKWFRRLRDNKLPMTQTEPFKVVSGYVKGNPNSTPQIKDWLFSLGWKPQTYKYVKEEDGEERKIPQVRYPKNHPQEGHLCQSVLDLKHKEPKLELLEGLTVVNHRKAFFKAMLDSERGGYLVAAIDGLTNTLRFKHKKPLANIPGVDKPWGKEIRSCLIAEGGKLLCGADMTSLESTTKRHYMLPYDPDYVAEMSEEGFDEHLDLAEKAGAISQSDLEHYRRSNEGDERWEQIHKVRKKFKPVNYGSVYGIGAPKLSREMGVSLKEAAYMIKAYWRRNWSVKRLAEEQYVKEVNGEMWLKNPVSGIYHNLRFDKDRFSTLNQSTGVFCFDMWIKEVRKQGIKFCGQFHDEHICQLNQEDSEKVEKIYTKALDKLNSIPILRVPLGMEAQFGNNYSEIH
jgi:hypothetical protein